MSATGEESSRPISSSTDSRSSPTRRATRSFRTCSSDGEGTRGAVLSDDGAILDLDVSTGPAFTPSRAVRSIATRVVSAQTTNPRFEDSVGAEITLGASVALDVAAAVGARVVGMYDRPCCALIFPPPGGGPYCATTSGD